MKGKGFIVEVEIRKSEFQVNFFRFDHNFEPRIVSGFEGCRILILNVGNKCTFSIPFLLRLHQSAQAVAELHLPCVQKDVL